MEDTVGIGSLVQYAATRGLRARPVPPDDDFQDRRFAGLAELREQFGVRQFGQVRRVERPLQMANEPGERIGGHGGASGAGGICR
jgi:hypothetical protein